MPKTPGPHVKIIGLPKNPPRRVFDEESIRNTAIEAQSIHDMFPTSAEVSGRDASKVALQSIHSPRFLHIATHGMFLPEEVTLHDEVTATDEAIFVTGGDKPLSRTVVDERLVSGLGPLERSALALAGSNEELLPNREAGLLTAMEITALDLVGTEVVFLSACETGIGDVPVGGGFAGLRAALVAAGSKSQVLTLWNVSDTAAPQIDKKFYEYARTGKGTPESLGSAQRAMISAKSVFSHPYYWAAFVASGEGRTLNISDAPEAEQK
jgi:CHAT domain-containing protein